MKRIALPISVAGSQFVINQKYVDYITNSGYYPVLMPELIVGDELSTQLIEETAHTCDGLILPGGIDIEPTFYDEVNYNSQNCDPCRDDFERQVLYAFLALGKPVFGICRGFQLLAREFLRTAPEEWARFFEFEQHVGSHNQSSVNAARTTPSHRVAADMTALYNEPAAADQRMRHMFVNSMHHQALRVRHFPDYQKTIGNPLVIYAGTEYGWNNVAKNKSLIVEAFGIANFHGGPVRGVQWHPEELNDVELLTTFFESVWKKKELNHHA